MWIVRLALRRPYTIAVGAVLILLMGALSIFSMSVDIFPSVDIPVVACIWTYSGLSAEEMERRIVLVHERAISTTLNGIEKMESQSIPGVGIIKIFLQEGADVGGAISNVMASAQSIARSLPPGTVPPGVVQYSAANVPIAQMNILSDSMPEEQIFDYAFIFVRAQMFSIPGLSIPLPYGGKFRQVSVDIQPDKLVSKGLSSTDLVNALQTSNLILPAGVARIGNLEYNISMNSSPTSIDQFNNIPIKIINGASINIGDVAHVSDGFMSQFNVVRVNGRRATYLNMLKKTGASTLAIISSIRNFIPTLEKIAPKGMKFSISFDQSVFVKSAIMNVLVEALFSSILVSFMIFLFLGSWRSMLVVCTSIPLAILCAIFGLKLNGNSIDIMTLGGLSLAVGMLVDDATVEVENIHRNRLLGLSLTSAILAGAEQIALPAIMATLAICIVFFPVVLLTGPARFLFVPMALSVVFAMFASYILSRTLVPLLCKILLESEKHDAAEAPSIFNRAFEAFQNFYVSILEVVLHHRKFVLVCFLVMVGVSAYLVGQIGTDFFPQSDAGLIKFHFRAPVGTRIEATEEIIKKVENRIREIIPANELDSISSMLGTPFGISLILVPTDNVGGMDSEVLISLLPKHKPSSIYRKLIRQMLTEEFPEAKVSFQSADIVNQVLNFGLSAPIDIQIEGSNYNVSYDYAKKLRDLVRLIPGTADVGIKQVFDSPSIKVEVDRNRAARFGLSQRDISNSLLITLSSSIALAPSFFLNPANGVNYSVAVRLPKEQMGTVSELLSIPITSGGGSILENNQEGNSLAPLGKSSTQVQRLGNMVSLGVSSSLTSINHSNVQRVVNVTANVEERDLGAVVKDIRKSIKGLGELPAGTKIEVRGQAEVMDASFKKLGLGLVLAIVFVYLLMVVLFQSWLDPFIVIVAVPGALMGILWMLFLTKTTINVESLMGSIMAIGIAASNSILLVSFANDVRIEKNLGLLEAVIEAGRTRLRPIMMTAIAMILGMLPAALGHGEGGEQNAPLARAVVGGLMCASLITVFIVPIVYCMLRKNLPTKHLLDLKFKADENQGGE